MSSRSLPCFLAVLIVILSLVGCTGNQPEAAAPTYTVGVLNHAASLEANLNGFKESLAALGYTEGKNITYLYDGPTGSADALGPALQSLLSKNPDLIFTIGTPATTQAKTDMADKNVPVIFAPVNDPVKSGIVDSLDKPGGMFTGIRAGAPDGKALEWLLKVAPETSKIFVPHVPTDNSSVQSLTALTEAAAAFGVELVVAEVATAEDIQAAVEAMPEDVDAIQILRSGQISSSIDVLVQAAITRGIPIVSSNVDLVKPGALIGYGPEYLEMGKQAARLADQILHGSKPADLPVETGEFFLYINLVTADAIGITISDETLRQAHTIIRAEDSN